MMDVIAGAFGTLKTASDIAQGLLALKTDTAVSTKALELNRVIADVQQQLFTAQTDYATVLRRVQDLEAQIVQFKDWQHEKQRYQLYELAPATLVYRVKPDMQNGEPVHDLCPNCYQDGIKSILQNNGYVKSHDSLTCPRCQTVLLLPPSKTGFIEISPAPDAWGNPRGF
ncbi:hypothetical protein [Aquitalea sp. LB_tupeE]|uniref:hypothetical protein n=1 Tax=Aquitalea sp. LB_tupeE TaxID=2748078 RepID=UPI0015BAB4F8|nr:hypothetical protein [Aquitalea sp. LB_tupeE]NWK80350.1 hypothetical protein [Aquitalea sp. LB_tupeE]